MPQEYHNNDFVDDNDAQAIAMDNFKSWCKNVIHQCDGVKQTRMTSSALFLPPPQFMPSKMIAIELLLKDDEIDYDE